MATYRFKEGKLTLIDPALDLNYQASFTPPLLPPECRQGQVVDKDLVVQVTRYAAVTYAYGLLQQGHYEGEYVLVYPSGAIKGRQYYLKGQLHGPSYFYSSAGKITAKSWFLEGKQVGIALWYYADGRIYSRQHYAQGLHHHTQEYYYPDGSLKTMMHYHLGRLHGETSLYHPDGALDRAMTFSHGQLVTADIQPPHPAPLS